MANSGSGIAFDVYLYKNTIQDATTYAAFAAPTDVFPAPSDLGWENPGYTFVEWNTSADGSGTGYSIGSIIPSIRDLYAIWGKEAITYTVTDAELKATADAIRALLGSTDTIEWESGTGFASALASS